MLVEKAAAAQTLLPLHELASPVAFCPLANKGTTVGSNTKSLTSSNTVLELAGASGKR
jgi:hypothetical protein